MTMPSTRRTTCRVCAHIARETIDAQLAEGRSPYSIADEYGLKKDSVYRHKANHWTKALVGIAGKAREAKQASLLARIEAEMGKVERVAKAGEASGNARMVLDSVAQMRGLLELLGKASGELRDSPQVAVNLIASPDWVRLRAAIFEVLAEYPDARAALSTRLLQLEGGQ